MYAEAYQPMSPRLWNSSVMRGTAVATMVRSRATRNRARKLDRRISQNFALLGLKREFCDGLLGGSAASFSVSCPSLELELKPRSATAVCSLLVREKVE